MRNPSRDLKSLLHVDEVLCRTRKNMEKLILLMLIVYTIAVLVGEKVRDRMFPAKKNGAAILAFSYCLSWASRWSTGSCVSSKR